MLWVVVDWMQGRPSEKPDGEHGDEIVHALNGPLRPTSVRERIIADQHFAPRLRHHRQMTQHFLHGGLGEDVEKEVRDHDVIIGITAVVAHVAADVLDPWTPAALKRLTARSSIS